MVVGLKGEGSMDGPCMLGPGQWKYVRVIVMAREAGDRTLPLALFTGDEADKLHPEGDPADKATLHLVMTEAGAGPSFKVVSQDPVTLAYTCQFTSSPADNTCMVHARPAPESRGRVRVVPDLTDDAWVPPGRSLVFTVVPSLTPGMKALDADLEISGAEDLHRFHFEVPAGKRVYYGLGHTSESSGGGGTECTNQGDFAMPPMSWQMSLGLGLGAMWAPMVNTFGSHDNSNQPTQRHTDVRGATIRPALKTYLKDMETSSFTHPMAAAVKGAMGFIVYGPSAIDPKKTDVTFFSLKPAEPDKPDPVQLNEEGHSGRWPYLRALYDKCQAFAVWEDTTDAGSDVAFRTSAEGDLTTWAPVTYLTRHAKGVDDPVVQVSPAGALIAAWGDLRSGTSQVYTRISRDLGVSWDPEVAIPAAAGEKQSWPQAAFLPGGGYALVYASRTGDQVHVLTRILDDAGHPAGGPVALSHPGAACGEPQIAADGAGHLYAVWREGEGTASEIWFSSSPGKGGPWAEPRQITHDNAYSEYPLVGILGDTLWVSCHSDISGVADLKYIRESADQGKTWGEAVTTPSLDAPVDRAWVEMNFMLHWPREDYHPAAVVTISLNDRQVGRLDRILPEGTYVFDAPADAVHSSGSSISANQVKVHADANINQADHVLVDRMRIVAKRRYTQVPLVASSQAEADELAAKSGVTLNHSLPDLAVCANAIPAILAQPKQGTTLSLPLQVRNLGEAPATGVKVFIYGARAGDPQAPDSAAVLAHQDVGSVAPGEMKEITVTLKFTAKTTSRVFVAVRENEDDYYPADNTWPLSFSIGASNAPGPLVGTDVPNVFSAPDLLSQVQLPNLPALQDLLGRPDFAALANLQGWSLPNVPNPGDWLQSRINEHLPNVSIPGVNIPTLPGTGTVGVPGL